MTIPEDFKGFAQFVSGKKITGVRFDEEELTGVDFIFDDGSELELYAFNTKVNPPRLGRLSWVLVSSSEAELG